MTTKLETLQSTIRGIDCLSQSGLSEISTLASMALQMLETERAYLSPESIATVLSTIRNTALETEDMINSEAESVGCNYTDEAAERRSEARRAADLRRNETQERKAA